MFPKLGSRRNTRYPDEEYSLSYPLRQESDSWPLAKPLYPVHHIRYILATPIRIKQKEPSRISSEALSDFGNTP